MRQNTTVTGSFRRAMPGARLIERSDPNKVITVSIYARKNPRPSLQAFEKCARIDQDKIVDRKYLTAAEFAEVYGSSNADVNAIAAFAKSNGLKVVESSAKKRKVLVSGKMADIEKAFGVELNEYEHPEVGRFRGRVGTISIPADLASMIDGVFGLDTRPIGAPRCRKSRYDMEPVTDAKAGKLKNPFPGTFFPPEVASLYHYPAEFDGTGQNIAVFAFNGGTDGDPHGGYRPAALKTYFEGTLGGKMPKFTDVVVTGPGNNPGPDTQASSQNGDATGEVMLDLCVVGSCAPGAHIFVYFTEFTSQGWVDAIQEAITDNNDISVISISYGNPENDPRSAWTLSGIHLVNQALQAARSKGITICCASGDDGSTDQATSGSHADFPASSPFVLGVGGTSLTATGGSTPQIAKEVVWNDLLLAHPEGAGGGGVSSIFSKPSYQANANVPPSADPPHSIGRGVPDVAAVADPNTAVVVMHVSGKKLEPIGGTSAAAPLWASLILRLNQGLGKRCGFLNPTLYASLSTGVLHDITSGNNGAYEARVGWDACTGFGSPDGEKMLTALRNAPAPP
jgi:kumamolisin